MSTLNPFQQNATSASGGNAASGNAVSGGIPELGTSGQRKLNVKVLVFIGVLALAILALFYFMIGTSGRKDKNPPKEQVLSIPQPPAIPKPPSEPTANITAAPAPAAPQDPGSALRLRRTGGATKPGAELPKDPPPVAATPNPAYVVTAYGAPGPGGLATPAPEQTGQNLARRRALDSGGVVTVLGGRLLSAPSNRGGSSGSSAAPTAATSNTPPTPSSIPPGLSAPALPSLSGLTNPGIGAPLGALAGTSTGGQTGMSAPGAFGVPSTPRGGSVQQLNQESPSYMPPTPSRVAPSDVPPGLQAPGTSQAPSNVSSITGSTGQMALDAAPTVALMQFDESDNAQEQARPMAFPVSQARSVPIDPSTYIPQGTALRCVLQTLIMTDIPGPTSCTVVEDIRSFDARRVLIPKGSRVIGEYRPASASVDRVAIIWTRVITPQNIDISINSPGVSPLGTLGVQGEVDNRWGERLSGALMLSLASDAFKYAIQTRGPTIETVTYNAQGVPIVTRQPFDSATVRNAERFVEQDLARSMRIPPRIVILQGTVVSILTAQDLSFAQVLAGR